MGGAIPPINNRRRALHRPISLSSQALLSPLAGLFGDRANRVHVIAFASFLWGVMTIAMGLAQTYGQMLAFSCVNGLGLALLIPCVQSLLADYYTPANRGRAFGLLYFTSSLGERKEMMGEGGWIVLIDSNHHPPPPPRRPPHTPPPPPPPPMFQ